MYAGEWTAGIDHALQDNTNVGRRFSLGFLIRSASLLLALRLAWPHI
jgi:hypothetical protein